MTFIALTNIFEYGYLANTVILGSAFLLLVESFRMLQLHHYCAIIEKRIDKTAKMSIEGWETHLRKLGTEGSGPTKWLLVSFVILFGGPFTIFNFLASFMSSFWILGLHTNELSIIRYGFFILAEFPALLFFVRQAYLGFKGWAKSFVNTY